MRLFINSLAASAGGGLTYIRNVLPHLAAKRDVQITVALSGDLRREFSGFPQVSFLELEIPPARRFWYEQSKLPGLIRRCDADVLLSTGNFALRSSPVPQILLSRNSIYTSPDFYRDLRLRRDYGAWLDTHLRALLAKRSVHWANVTVAPSEAFAAELRRWTGMRILAIPHGFNHEAFTADSSPLTPDVRQKLRAAEGSVKLLFVSHYNYYRNFETLIRAMPLLRDRTDKRSVKLLLTCSLVAGKNPGAYRPEQAAELVKKLAVSDMVVELGTIPYGQLHQVYARADLYVTPAYTETFAHPLVEAMASGLPVVASDLPVHREICGQAALYFARFSPEELAERVTQVVLWPERSRQMAASGLERSPQFSWESHVDRILELGASLIHLDDPGFTKERQGKTSKKDCADSA
jgi:glycosyltransferase involved in cell wall biosynthesis